MRFGLRTVIRRTAFAGGHLASWERMGPVAVIAAHPDDETIGVGAQLPGWHDVYVIHVTDGAPRHGRDALALGFASREDYARARRSELRAAMTLAGIGTDRLRWAGYVDQEASLDLGGLARRLAEMIGDVRPAEILTHPYEGGHPDHDATAFAIHAACALLGHAAPRVREFTSYHAAGAAMSTFAFLPAPTAVSTFPLTSEQRAAKRRMLGCFASQQPMLCRFSLELERLREAPLYDFTQPPHPGTLFYEQFDWGMDGARWRTHARLALETIGLRGKI